MFYLDASRDRAEWSDTVWRTSKMNQPLAKNRQKQYKMKAGQRIRVNMSSDTFLPEAKEWMPEFWDIIRKRPDLIFWLLTKRPENIMEMLPDDWNDGYENVILNITTENQTMFDKRWPILQNIPAKHKGICCAPMISTINIEPALSSGQIEDVSCGGENYDGSRILKYEWVKSLSEQCAKHRVNFSWYESGTRPEKDGVVYFLPRKEDQTHLAYVAGLNQYFGPHEYKLYDPDDGHRLSPDELYQRKFNRNRCFCCSSRMSCCGCLSCGDCKDPPDLVTLEELWSEEQKRMETMNMKS
jgi:protein gp37